MERKRFNYITLYKKVYLIHFKSFTFIKIKEINKKII